MRIFPLFLLPLVAAAQAPQANREGAFLTGVLLERDAPANSGQFSVRAADNQVFRYLFDSKTYVERDNQLIDVARLRPGDKVEVLSDKMPGAALRYAITIHVVAPPAPPPPQTADRTLRRPRTYAPQLEQPQIFTGSLSYSGLVFRVGEGRLVLHTRDGADRTILLRKDTRYMEDGRLVEAADLKPNMLVFVRAGRSLYDEIEAYQVIWGRILQPK